MDALIVATIGCATSAAGGLLWLEYLNYRARLNRIADDIQWHTMFRSPSQ